MPEESRQPAPLAPEAKAGDLPSCAAVLLAAGRSTRMGGSVRKPFLELSGRRVIDHTLAAFRAARGVVEFIVVASEDDVESLREWAPADLRVVAGGAERTDSVRCGAEAVSPTRQVVLVHDVARPLVLPEHIEAVARTAMEEGAALLAVPVRDTIKQSEGSPPLSQHTLDRAKLWAAQTPQGFRREVLLDLLQRAAADDGFTPTDDAALHERYVGPVPLVEGDPSNLKLTTPADLAIAQAILDQRTP